MERDAREYGTTRRQLHVIKMRGVRFQDGRHDFVINTGGLELFPRLLAPKELYRNNISILKCFEVYLAQWPISLKSPLATKP
jgi:KaiC/GvpD/RAD55 family RecA-like ATPase